MSKVEKGDGYREDVYTDEETKLSTALREQVLKWHEESNAKCLWADDEKEQVFQLTCLIRAKDTVQEAFAMYKGIAIWRTEKKIDSILDTPFSLRDEVDILVPSIHHGYSKAGRPIYIEKTGAQKISLLLKRVTTNKFLEYHIRFMERTQQLALARSKETGRRVKSSCVILDCKGLGFSHRKLLDWFKVQATLDTSYYSEVLGQLFVINTPSIFSAVYKLAKRYIEPNTQKKIFIFSDRKAWQPVLYKYIDRSQLPLEYGGTCRCEHKGPSPETIMRSNAQAAKLKPCIPVMSDKLIKDRMAAEKKLKRNSSGGMRR